MATKQAIGFANTFYTLWSIDVQPKYTVDCNGKAWLTGYNTYHTYHKNISTDLEKAKAAYPELNIHDDLIGKTSSWESKSEDDLCPQIMKFGKYAGHDLNILAESDFDYVLWLVENKGYSSNGKYAYQLSKVVAHFAAKDQAEKDRIENNDSIFSNLLKAGSYTFIAHRNLQIHGEFAYITVEVEGIFITFCFNDFSLNEYNGHEYGLPVINGKAKRIKGKSITVEITEKKMESSVYDVQVTNFKINK